MKIATSILFVLSVACFCDAQAIQQTYCTNSATCSLPNPASSGNMLVAIGGLPSIIDAQGDTFLEIYAKGWYANASPMWYATGVRGGPVTIQPALSASGGEPIIPFIYLAEYPPAALDHVAPQVFNCCNPSSTIGLTTTFLSELLIEWTIYKTSVSVQDSVVSPGAHSFTIPQGGPSAQGIALASFRLLGPEFVKYKAPYYPIQIKQCIGATCEFDNPVLDNDLLVAAISESACGATFAGCVTDTQMNAWQLAVSVPYDGSIWYVLNAKPGTPSISFKPSNAPNIIIAEYPPAVGFEGSNYGTYATQNIDGSNGQSDDVGWSSPVQTTKPCDLLVSMGIINAPADPTSNWIPGPVPYFTSRAGLAHRIGFEDSTSGIPGIYIASMRFDAYTHWTEGLAAFDMNGCK